MSLKKRRILQASGASLPQKTGLRLAVLCGISSLIVNSALSALAMPQQPSIPQNWLSAAKSHSAGMAFRPVAPKTVTTTTVTTIKEGVPYHFVAFGDWGAGNSFQKDIAAQMAALYQRSPFDTVVSLGDNIYPIGDVNSLGKTYFTDMYAPLLTKGVRFYMSLGNHDRSKGFENDQVKFFKMPGYYYKFQKPNIEFFVLDTNIFANDSEQREWLKKSLEESCAPWKIVLGHHPIYSSGEHGSNKGLKQTLEPILINNHVPLYLAGHDHDYERFEPINAVQHIVSGGGGAWPRNFATVAPHSKLRIKSNNFLSFKATRTHLSMQAIDGKGNIIDHAGWDIPLKQSCKP